MRYGFKLENIHLVDFSAANIALHNRTFTSAQRKKMRCKSGLLSEICAEWADGGVRMNAIHMDFCDPIFALTRGKPAVEIPKVIRTGIIEEGLLAVTFLSGREQDGCDDDATRFRRLKHLINSEIEVPVPRTATMLWEGDYHNPVSHNTMLWAVYDIRRK